MQIFVERSTFSVIFLIVGIRYYLHEFSENMLPKQGAIARIISAISNANPITGEAGVMSINDLNNIIKETFVIKVKKF